MIKTDTLPVTEPSDADLVSETLGGRRDAFRQIVERYQNLICSIAYSATGNVSRSHDVAQETFLAAWTRLPTLREPQKLRGWLCGIVRHRVYRNHRDDRQQPVSNATPLHEVEETASLEPLPTEQAVSREEETILWRSLEKIPPLYREPLILFYREHQSISQVALALDLTEDAVKQRLSRGRRLLQDEVQAFVENTLRRTAPGPTFSSAALAMLPLVAAPAASVGVAAGAKGSVAAKSGGFGILLVPVVPFLGIAAGVAAQWLIVRELTTDRRLRVKRVTQLIVGWTVYIAMAAGGESLMHGVATQHQWPDSLRFGAVVGYWGCFVMGTLTLQFVGLRRFCSARAGDKSPATAATLSPPMTAGNLAAILTGLHLAMFSWLAVLAWRAGDSTGVLIIVASAIVACLTAFTRLRGRPGGALAVLRGLGIHFGWVGAVILLILNLRADVWVASRYGMSIAEVRHVVPLWVVPACSAGLVAWAALLAEIATSRRLTS